MRTNRKTPGTKSERNQQTLNEYMAETVSKVVDMAAVAEWAIETGRWKPVKYDPVKVCARELSRAAREELYRDPQGREVRKKHCFTIIDHDGQYRWRWFDIVTATREQMHNSAQARRRMALGDVTQLATDIASFNDNNEFGAQIEMSFNFDEDLAELAHPTVYPGDEDDDDMQVGD